MRFPPVFIANYFGADVVEKFLNATPSVDHPRYLSNRRRAARPLVFRDHFVRHRAEIPCFRSTSWMPCSSVFKDQHDGSRGFGICIALVILFMKNDGQEEIMQRVKKLPDL